MKEGVPSLRTQLADARRAGLRVEPVRRTGEVKIECGCHGRVLKVNNRRKDGTRELAGMIDRHRYTSEDLMDRP